MKKTALALMAIALVIGFLGCEWFKKTVDYYPVGEGYVWKNKSTITSYDSIYNLETQVWDVTYDTSYGEGTYECVGETTLEDGTAVWELKSVGGPVPS